MQPDMEFCLNNHKITSKTYQPWTKKELDSFFNKLSKEKIISNVSTTSRVPGLLKMFKNARSNMWDSQVNFKYTPKYRVYLDVEDYDLSLIHI